LYYPKAAKQLAKLLKLHKPDVAHLHNISHQLTYSILKPLRKNKVPIVQTLHDYQVISPNYHLYRKGKIDESCRKHKYFMCALKRCVRGMFWPSLLATIELYLYWIMRWPRKVDLYISPSKFLATKFKEWGFKKQIKIIHNFIDCKKFEPNFEVGDYILSYGRLSREKGVMVLVKAVRKLPNVKLKIIGVGSEKQRIVNYIKAKQVKNIEVLGPRYGDDLFKLIAGARFVVIPSKWYENYPMTVLESMALGKPVMVSGLGGLKEMVTENYNGWLVNPGSIRDLRYKIKQYYNEDDVIKQLGEQARKTVEQKNCSEVYYKNLMEVYSAVIPEKETMSLG
jgi:glycosyltransferase involved in cell wall biosynthesis